MTWTAEARCTGRTNVMFSNFTIVAKKLCAACPVAEECLFDAMVAELGVPRDDRYYVRGGLTSLERFTLEDEWVGDDPVRLELLAHAVERRATRKAGV